MEFKFFSIATKMMLPFGLASVHCFANSIGDFKGSLFCNVSYHNNRGSLPSSLLANNVVFGGSNYWNSKMLDGIGKDKPNGKTLRKWLSTYCGADKRPHASIKENIRWVIPKMEPGIPVDRASTIQNKLRETATEIAKNFFSYASLNSLTSGPESSACSSDVTFYTLPLGAKKGNLFPDTPKADRQPPTEFMFFASATDRNAPIYLTSNAMTRFTLPSVDLGSVSSYEFEHVFVGVPDSIGYLPKNLKGLWVSPGPISIRVDNNGTISPQTVYPLRPFLYGDVTILRNSFILYIPEKEQIRLFGESMTGDTPSEFINNQDETWLNYFAKATHFQESPSEDGRYINFSVELDLGPICRFAIPQEDLLSR